MRENDDSRLVTAALGGDHAAFAALIERHQERVRALARAMLGDREEAEDVTQEALLRAYLGLAELRDPARFGAWLSGIAANVARMRLRERRRAGPAHAADGEEPELEEVQAALASLPASTRELVLMRYVDGLSSAEIGAALGRSPGAVRVRLHRARAQLRQHLTRREMGMVEASLEDVLVRVHDEELTSRLRIVLLKEKEGERVLPIWVGAAEGDALAWHLGGEAPLRPLSADLTARLLEAVNAHVERVTIGSLREKTFYATVSLAGREVDARPSDALNLAVRVGAPIFVDEEVMDACGLASSDELEADAARDFELPAGEWRSLSPEILRSLWETPGPK